MQTSFRNIKNLRSPNCLGREKILLGLRFINLRIFRINKLQIIFFIKKILNKVKINAISITTKVKFKYVLSQQQLFSTLLILINYSPLMNHLNTRFNLIIHKIIVNNTLIDFQIHFNLIHIWDILIPLTHTAFQLDCILHLILVLSMILYTSCSRFICFSPNKN